MEDSEYQSDTQCEKIEDYCMDGYHPVALGDMLYQGRYVIIQKLGWGTFSTVWLSSYCQNKAYYAIKIHKSEKFSSGIALQELEILNEINNPNRYKKWMEELCELQAIHTSRITRKNFLPLIRFNTFSHDGVHGKHYCSVFQTLGPSLLQIIQHYESRRQRMPVWLVKKIATDMLLGLVYLHEYCSIIHADLKLENISMSLTTEQQQQLGSCLKKCKIKPISMKFLKKMKQKVPSKEKEDKIKNFGIKKGQEFVKDQPTDPDCISWKGMRIQIHPSSFFKIIDYGNACVHPYHRTDLIQTREYRAPEIIAGLPYSTTADIWSLGCLLFQMLTNSILFRPKPQPSISEDEDQIYQMMRVLGRLPPEYFLKAKNKKEIFNQTGELKNGNPKDLTPIHSILSNQFHFSAPQSKQIEGFLLPMLEYSPTKRISARECLKNEWLWK